MAILPALIAFLVALGVYLVASKLGRTGVFIGSFLIGGAVGLLATLIIMAHA